MISVCMGIYNGQKYIEEQLLSIKNQTRVPDEVILCDDGSQDNTVKIVKEFIRKHQLEENWRLYENPENLGYPGNFYYAMGLCRGDIVFLADQDDIWDIRKIESMSQVMEARQELNVVCCKFGLVDGEGQDVHTLMAPARSKGSRELRKVTVENVFTKCEWPGMVLAYRRSWYENIRKNASGKGKKIPHDFLICAWAAEQDSFGQLDEELAWHRRHDSNVGEEEHRLGKLLNYERKIGEIRKYNQILDSFDREQIMLTQKGAEVLKKKQQVMKDRYCALESKKVFKVLGNIWKNRKYTRLATAICDIVIALRTQ